MNPAGSSFACQPPFAALEHALVDQRADELLDEERVALGPLHDHVAQPRRQLGGEQLVEHARGVVLRQRLEPDERGVAAPPPQAGRRSSSSGRAVPSSSSGPSDLAQDALEQVEQRLLGPVKILEQDDGRLLGDELGEELDPRLVQPLARRERVEVAGDVEAEREPEDLARSRGGRRAVSGVSLSRMPRCSLSTSPRAQ